MDHNAITLLVLAVVIAHTPMLYGAVFCRSERPMRRLVTFTEAVSKIAVEVLRSLLRK
jgi:hypothetical protein